MESAKPSNRMRNTLIAVGASVILVCGIIFVSCVSQPNEGAIQTAIAKTQAAESASVDKATATPAPTDTPAPSSTPTQRPTATASNTPLPPETQTAQAAIDALTATAVSQSGTATEIASFLPIDWRELTTYPEKHVGERVRISGRIFNIDGDVVQIFISGTQEAVYVRMLLPFEGLYEKDTIVVYGVVKGKTCFTNALGGQVCQPQVNCMFWTK